MDRILLIAGLRECTEIPIEAEKVACFLSQPRG